MVEVVTDQHMHRMRARYIELLRNIIINEIYKDPPILRQRIAPGPGQKRPTFTFSQGARYNQDRRDVGRDWPSVAHSMIGKRRMMNLQHAIQTVIEDGIPGDFIETGVWRGGACIFVQGILTAYGETHRRVFVADSFEGLPEPDAEKYPADTGDNHHLMAPLAITLDQVQDHFRAYDLLQDNVHFLKGWFKDTLPTAPIEELSVLRLDGDMYESTMDGLANLYHKVSPGGFVIVDDYGVIAACRAAVHDFLRSHGDEGRVDIQDIDGVGVFWRV